MLVGSTVGKDLNRSCHAWITTDLVECESHSGLQIRV
jgi:hypothetical protein